MFYGNLETNGLIEAEVYTEPWQASKMERFAKKKLKTLTIFGKRSILNVRQGSECTFGR